MSVCGDRQPALWVEHGTEADIHMTHCVGANIDYYVHKAYTATIGQWPSFLIHTAVNHTVTQLTVKFGISKLVKD